MENSMKQTKQILKEADPAGAYRLQEKLHDISKAGRAIISINNCLTAVNRLEPAEGDAEYSVHCLRAVYANDLEVAIDLLGQKIEEESNKLCAQFGLKMEH